MHVLRPQNILLQPEKEKERELALQQLTLLNSLPLLMSPAFSMKQASPAFFSFYEHLRFLPFIGGGVTSTIDLPVFTQINMKSRFSYHERSFNNIRFYSKN